MAVIPLITKPQGALRQIPAQRLAPMQIVTLLQLLLVSPTMTETIPCAVLQAPTVSTRVAIGLLLMQIHLKWTV